MSSEKPSTTHPETSTPAIDATHEEAFAAYRRVEPLLAEVTEPQRILTDIPRAVTTVLGAAGKLEELKPEIAGQLRRFDVTLIDRLPDLALAAWYAHVTASTVEQPISRLLDEAVPLRGKLLAAATAHVVFGDIDASRVDEIRQGSGYLDTAGDLVALAELFRGAWAKLEHRTLVTSADVARAEQLGTALVRALSDGRSSVSAAADRRSRAYTVLVNAYDECRRAITFVRWHEHDVDAILPSLFAKPRARKAKGSAEQRERPNDGRVPSV